MAVRVALGAAMVTAPFPPLVFAKSAQREARISAHGPDGVDFILSNFISALILLTEREIRGGQNT